MYKPLIQRVSTLDRKPKPKSLNQIHQHNKRIWKNISPIKILRYMQDVGLEETGKSFNMRITPSHILCKEIDYRKPEIEYCLVPYIITEISNVPGEDFILVAITSTSRSVYIPVGMVLNES